MGHDQLGDLPRSREWDEVVELIRGDGTAAQVAAAALAAAETGFRQAGKDEGVARVLWLLTQLPLAARDPNYVDRLASLGVRVPDAPGLAEMVGAFTDAVDAHMRRSQGRTDLGEMAQMAAVETLTTIVGQRTNSLFGSTSEDVRQELAALATAKQFGTLARDFFAGLSRRYLAFFLSRELSNHVGGDRRFSNIAEHREFNEALDRHCREASRIVEDYAGAWFSKTNWETGITTENTRHFAAYSLDKLRREFKRGAGTGS